MQAIISDIHGNLPAPKVVLRDIHRKGIARIICLSDVVGYGPRPVECIDIVRKRCEVTLCGNHDFAVVSVATCSKDYAREAIYWARERLTRGLNPWKKRARWRFLRNLPGDYHEGRVLYAHGSPRSPMEYIEESDTHHADSGPSKKLRDIFSQVEWLCFVSNTHVPGIFTDGYKYLPLSALPDLAYVVPKGSKTIVNVGAVGQPRDGDPRACYVTFDGETVRFHRVEYDIERVVANIERISELDDRLGTRLREGR